MILGRLKLASLVIFLHISNIAGFDFDLHILMDPIADIANLTFELDALRNAVEDISRNHQHQCFKAILSLYDGGTKKDQLRFFDSWAKIPSDFLSNAKISFGSFDECVAARKNFTENGNVYELKGRYSQIYSWLTLPSFSQIPENASYKELANVRIPFLRFGICLPSLCDKHEIQQIFSQFRTIKELLELFGKRSNNSNVGNQSVYNEVLMIENQHAPPDFGNFLGIYIFSTLVFIVLSSTLYEHFFNDKSWKYHKLAISFSLIKNSKDLFKIKIEYDGQSTSHIACLTGLRTISMAHIIYGHSFLWCNSFPHSNIQDYMDWLLTPLGLTVMSAGSSVDTFFLIGGTLVTFVGLHKLNNSKGRLNCAIMYFHRYMRLAPSLYFMVLLHASGLLKFLTTGPFWEKIMRRSEDNCRNNWWITSLFINNYFRSLKMCISSAWYIAVDMQLFLLAPFILYGFYKFRSKVAWVLMGLIVASQISTYAEMILYDLNLIISQGILSKEQIVQIYYRTHHRCIPWIVGTMFGYYLYHEQNRHQPLPKYMVTLLWLLSSATMLAMIFGPIRVSEDPNAATPIETATYEAVGRLAWSLSIAWIIFSCHMGYTPKVNALLSYAGWQLLDRLSLSLLLVSPTVQIISNASKSHDSYFTPFKQFEAFCAEYLISIFMAIFLCITVETSFVNVESFLIQN